jgi:hypothetical protein
VREAAGIAAATGLLAFAGTGVLRALGVANGGWRGLAAAGGLAYLTGIAVVMPLGIALLTVGVSFRLWLFTVTCAAVGGLGLLLARRREPAAPARGATAGATPPVPLRRLGAVLGLLAGAYLAIWLVTYLVTPLHAWDSWSIWGRKGAILATSDGLPAEFFTSSAYAFMHQDYPLLLPLLESVYYRAMGGVDVETVHAVFWLLLVAFVAALVFVGRTLGRPRVWVAVALAVVFAPLVYGQLSTAYADVPMAFFAGLGVLLLGRWTESTDPRELALAGLLLAAGAATKNEGLAAAFAALVAAALVVRAPRRASLARLGLTAAAIGASLAPWWVWVASRDIPEDELPVGKGLDPGYVAERLDRVLPALEAVARETLKQGGWLVPLAVLLVAAALATGVGRRAAAFYAFAALGIVASIVWSFVVTTATLDYQIETSAARVVMGVVFVAVAALVHVGGALDRRLAPHEGS